MDYTQILSHPMFLAALQAQGNPMGKAMMEQSMAARENQYKQAQIDSFHIDQQEKLRQREIEQKLPEALKGIDTRNPLVALQQLGERKITGEPARVALDWIFKTNNDATRLQHDAQRVGFDKERLGLDRSRLGIEQSRLGLDRQESSFKIQEMINKQSGVKTPDEVRKIEDDYRTELQALPIFKQTQEVKNAYDKVHALTTKANPSGFDDNAAITLGVKVNDAMSTVSPGETATARAAQGWLNKFSGQIQQMQAKGFLLPEDRKALDRMVKTAYNIQAKNYKDVSSKYTKRAEQVGGKAENVLFFNPQEAQEQDFNPQPVELKMPSGGSVQDRAKMIYQQKFGG